MRCIEDAKELKGKRVLVRVDFNISMGHSGDIGDDETYKLKATLPTIHYLAKKGAKVILMSHLGRPEGKLDVKYRLGPVAEHFESLLGRPVKHLLEIVGPKVLKEVEKMQEGEVILLENLRFHPGEEENDAEFAEQLSELGDIYINDAFAVSHRDVASIVGITKFLPSYAGFLLEKEVMALEKIKIRPKRPLVVIMGGLKFETKLPVIEKLLPHADKILLGGGLAITCLAALGYWVGDSVIDRDYLEIAKKIAKNKKVLLPTDVLVGRKDKVCDYYHLPIPIKPRILVNSPYAILDVGPGTLSEWSKIIKSAATLVWNGPTGFFEEPPFDTSTLAVARMVAARSQGRAFGVAGGGETVTAIFRSGVADDLDHISTGGGAMLEFLSGKKMPGLEALEKNKLN